MVVDGKNLNKDQKGTLMDLYDMYSCEKRDLEKTRIRVKISKYLEKQEIQV